MYINDHGRLHERLEVAGQNECLGMLVPPERARARARCPLRPTAQQSRPGRRCAPARWPAARARARVDRQAAAAADGCSGGGGGCSAPEVVDSGPARAPGAPRGRERGAGRHVPGHSGRARMERSLSTASVAPSSAASNAAAADAMGRGTPAGRLLHALYGGNKVRGPPLNLPDSPARA